MPQKLAVDSGKLRGSPSNEHKQVGRWEEKAPYGLLVPLEGVNEAGLNRQNGSICGKRDLLTPNLIRPGKVKKATSAEGLRTQGIERQTHKVGRLKSCGS